MNIDEKGWLTDIRHHLSPNFDDRPSGHPVDLLVIHNISLPPEQFEGDWILDFFCNELDPQAHPYFQEIANLEVSAHLLIRRSGEIIQFVSFDQRAWHAGQSCYQGRERCNDFSIGIELEGSDNQPFTESQYQALQQVTRLLMQHYPALSLDRIAGHSEIAPDRKTDPGPCFDWQHYRKLLSTPA
jgi:AmpD protein